MLDLVAAWRRERPGRRRCAWRLRPSWPKRRLLLVNGPLVFCRRTHPVAKLNTKKLRTMTATSNRLYGRAALITIKAVKPPNISYRRSPNSCGVHATKETIGKVNRKRTTLQFGAPSKASTSPAVSVRTVTVVGVRTTPERSVYGVVADGMPQRMGSMPRDGVPTWHVARSILEAPHVTKPCREQVNAELAGRPSQ